MLAVSAPAAAQAPADLMAGCIGIARDADRLACFDAALAKVSPQARAASEARAVETARLKAAEAAAEAEAKRDSFGAEGVAARGEKRFAPPPGEMQEVETAITEVLTNSSGLGVFLLENGQLWKQADTARLPNVRVGDRVKLTRGPLGGYKLNFLKQKGWVLVKRVR
ncbi:hypothetical protein [Polymorphobacter fuscus]|uniref:Uncharacterized protein n=1 Tax=Sandarakinorhabdus fusca TaxID=1439888 RepID=A0A7C9GX17_9SPHN|nr:hypothetical protein [Polymorphobacter fuscus]KAB7644444.1 hypothetical protein F9290_14030 [Polymorphobacter fuscus]MQT18369.1 hypothetical protein [Polymorphobacter fuscus]NJC08269.1 hypothetical protein [Polymorphobacter fuscus]